MTPQALISTTAASYGIPVSDLATAVSSWDLSGLIAANADLAGRVIAGHAEELAKRAAKIAARKATLAARALAALTPAARATPQFACTRCDGKGVVRGFSHIEGGRCFACCGAGVRKPGKGA